MPTVIQELRLELPSLPGVPEPGPFEFTFVRHGDERSVRLPFVMQGRDPEAASRAQVNWLQAQIPRTREVGVCSWRLGPRQWTWLLDALEAAGGRPPWRAQLALAEAQALHAAEPPQPDRPYRADAPVDGPTRERARAADLAKLDRAVAAAGGWVEPLLARAYRRLGWHSDAAGALEDCALALALEPDNPEALAQQASAYRTLGDARSELSALERAAAQPGVAHSIWHQLGDAARRSGELEQAQQAFDRAVALEPSNPYHATEAALVQNERGEQDAAVQTLRAVVEKYPDYVHGLTALGRVLVNIPGREGEAQEALDAAVAAGPDYAYEALSLRGSLARLRGHPERGVTDLRAALAMNDALLEAHAEVGISLAALDRDDEALAHLDRYLERARWAPALRVRARLLKKKGQHERARRDLEACLELDPEDEDAAAALAGLEDGG